MEQFTGFYTTWVILENDFSLERRIVTHSKKIEAFTDADWAGCANDRRSESGSCIFVWGNLVTWRSKKQNIVARSSAKLEFRSMTHGVCELILAEKDFGRVEDRC